MNTQDTNELQKEITSEVPSSANLTVSDYFQNNELQPVQKLSENTMEMSEVVNNEILEDNETLLDESESGERFFDATSEKSKEVSNALPNSAPMEKEELMKICGDDDNKSVGKRRSWLSWWNGIPLGEKVKRKRLELGSRKVKRGQRKLQ